MKVRLDWILIAAFCFGLYLHLKQPGPGPGPSPVPTVKATAATFVYEKDQHVVPAPVLAALDKLNRERGIISTIFEQDTKDGTGEVPSQYRTALEAAKKEGLPALVVLSGDTVLRVVKDPKTAEQINEAVK